MDPKPSPRLKLRRLICNPKSYGAKNITVKGRTSNGGTARTREDPYLPQVFSYECKTAEEWLLLTTGISKQLSNQNAFHAFAHFVDADLPPGPAARVACEVGEIYALSGKPADSNDAFTLDCIKATLQSYAGQPDSWPNLKQCLERIINAVRGTVGHGSADTPVRSEPTISEPAEAPPVPADQTGGDSQSGSVGEAGGVYGEFIPVKSVKSLAAMLKELAEDPEEKTIFTKQQDPAGDHDSGAGGEQPPPQPALLREALPAGATLSESAEAPPVPADQTGGDSQSGSVGEALEESEPTLSPEDAGRALAPPSADPAAADGAAALPPDVIVDTPEPPPTTIEGTPAAIAAAIVADDAAQGTSQEEKWQKTIPIKEARASQPIAALLKTPKLPAKKAVGKKK